MTHPDRNETRSVIGDMSVESTGAHHRIEVCATVTLCRVLQMLCLLCMTFSALLIFFYRFACTIKYNYPCYIASIVTWASTERKERLEDYVGILVTYRGATDS